MSGAAVSIHRNVTGNLALIELMFHDAILMKDTMTDFARHFHRYAQENDLAPDEVQDALARRLDVLALDLQKPVRRRFFKTVKAPRGMYIWGGVGRGKTMMMDLFFDYVPIHEKRRVHFNIFMLDVHNSVKILREDGKGKDPLYRIAREIADNCRLLCFDEFQVYDIADAMVLSALFKALFENGVTVIATTNVAPDDLYKNGLQRVRFLPFIDVVKKHMDIVHVDTPIDYRQQALRENGVYFVHDAPRMKQLFDHMITPHSGEAARVDVGGRDLPVDHAADGCAWVSFTELCEKPRAVADYKALINRYHTVFLSFVPRMGYDRRNEIKRFILLIDTLYDAHVRLIINAECAPDKLYHGSEHAFEFERTVSRLLEMQGEDYLMQAQNSQPADMKQA